MMARVNSPLLQAINGKSSIENVTEILKYIKKEDLNKKEFFQRTALYAAAERNRLDIVKKLLELGADPTLPNTDGQTPLFIASYKGYNDIVKALLTSPSVMEATDKINKELKALNDKQKETKGEYDLLWIKRKIIKKELDGKKNDKLLEELDGKKNDKLLVQYESLKKKMNEMYDNQGKLKKDKEELNNSKLINIASNVGKTPLIIAIENKHIETAKELLAHGADINKGFKGDTPLKIAETMARQNPTINFTGIINILNEKLKTADPITGATSAATAAPPITDATSDMTAAPDAATGSNSGNNNAPAPAAPDAATGATGSNSDNNNAPAEITDMDITTLQSDVVDDPLFQTIKNGTIDEINKIVNKGNVNNTNSYGFTLLFFASIFGNLNSVNALIAHGADVNKANTYGMTPLYWASSKGFLEIVQALIRAGADINAVMTNGSTPLHRAIMDKRSKIVEELLTHKSIDINIQNVKGNTPLMMAVIVKDLDIVKELLNRGANINIQNKQGNTPLMMAVIVKDLDIVKELLNRGANINIQNNENKNAVDISIKKGFREATYMFNMYALAHAASPPSSTIFRQITANQVKLNDVITENTVSGDIFLIVKIETSDDTKIKFYGRKLIQLDKTFNSESDIYEIDKNQILYRIDCDTKAKGGSHRSSRSRRHRRKTTHPTRKHRKR